MLKPHITDDYIKEQRWKIKIIYGVALALIIVIGGAFVWGTLARSTAIESTEHTRAVQETIKNIGVTFADADLEARDAQIYRRESADLKTYEDAVRTNIDKFQKLTVDNPRQQESALQISRAIEARFATNRILINTAMSGNYNNLVGYIRDNNAMNDIRKVAMSLKVADTEEARLYDQRLDVARNLRYWLTGVGGVSILVLLILWGISYYHQDKFVTWLANTARHYFDLYYNAETGEDGTIHLPKELAERLLIHVVKGGQ